MYYTNFLLLAIIMILCILVILLSSIISVEQTKETYTSRSKYIPIYIISLEKRKKDRLVPLLANIEKDSQRRYGVRKVFAVNGHEKVVDAYENMMDGHFLNKGQIGCWLSHVGMWRTIANSHHGISLILEDDAEIRLPEMLNEIYAIIKELPADWALCYLGGRYAKPEDAKHVSSRLQRSDSVIWHSHAYLITKAGAAKLLEQSSSFNGSNLQSDFKNVKPVDDWMTSPDRNLGVYKVEPELIHFKYDNVSDT